MEPKYDIVTKVIGLCCLALSCLIFGPFGLIIVGLGAIELFKQKPRQAITPTRIKCAECDGEFITTTASVKCPHCGVQLKVQNPVIVV